MTDRLSRQELSTLLLEAHELFVGIASDNLIVRAMREASEELAAPLGLVKRLTDAAMQLRMLRGHLLGESVHSVHGSDDEMHSIRALSVAIEELETPRSLPVPSPSPPADESGQP